MEKVALTDNAGAMAARSASSTVVKREPAATPELAAKGREAVTTADTSMASLGADAEKGRLKSLSALEGVAESIDDAIQVLNQALSLKNTAAVIRRDEDLNRYLVTIKDKDSGEVVRQIPDEALLKFARNLQELRGILFDETT